MYTLKKITTAIKGTFKGTDDAIPITHLLIDSRKVATTEQSLFFALEGEHHNGHDYIETLYNKGVRNFVVRTIPDLALPKANFIQVAHTLEALQQLVARHRSTFDIPVIGITGSNGKTIVKEWLYQLLQEVYYVVRSPKSYNSQVGVPLSVWQLNEEHELAIFEAGISQVGEMEKLQHIIAPTIGIFTNIGNAHGENFPSIEDKIQEKLHLFKNCETLIYCKDHTLIAHEIRESSMVKQARPLEWSFEQEADLQITHVERHSFGTTMDGEYLKRNVRISIPFTDDASVENAIHCWLLLLHLNCADAWIEKQMKKLVSITMRLELKEGIHHCTLINDSYNSDIESLSIALDFLHQQGQHDQKTLIISDILQNGMKPQLLYQQVAELIRNRPVDRMIGIGKEISRHVDYFSDRAVFFPDTDEALPAIRQMTFENETILLKGARPFQFEKISRLLEQKKHQTVLEINLTALIHNLNYFRSRLAPHTKIMAMVKAFSYGSGSFEIANILQFHHVDYLAVAYIDEGVELRKAGITLPILVMNPETAGFERLIKYRLEPEIYNFHTLNRFEKALEKAFYFNGEPYPIHIKLETGMHRLGFEQADTQKLIAYIQTHKKLKIRSVFSHLAASDKEAHRPFTIQQITTFREMSETFLKAFPYPILRHILNSSGITSFPEAQFDMVRLGIGLHGVHSDREVVALLRPVSTLRSVISQIKQIEAGESVGYNRSFTTDKQRRIATIPIGYADGLSRHFGNGRGSLLIKGKKAALVGDVCMDMCMADVTHCDAQEGDPVIFFGEQMPIDIFAKQMDTIPYEVLTSISRRVKRIYYQE